MGYSAKDMRMASRIAYYDVDLDLLEVYGYDLTMRDLLKMNPHIREKLERELASADSDMQRYRAREAFNDYEEIIAQDSDYGDWKIRKVHDTNADTGFYGCLIETGEEEAVVGFRGSEDFTEGGNLVNDWLKADFGMTDSVRTQQQYEAERFMEEIARSTDYEEYGLTGHSLGGNLAFHAAIEAPESLRGRIVRCVSLDGPGFSDEYLTAHRDKIREMAGVMTHYQWSLVGAVFRQPEGVIQKPADVQAYGDLSFSLFRHDMGFVILDENGEIVEGKADTVSLIIKTFTRYVDILPETAVFPLTFVLKALNMEGVTAEIIKDAWQAVVESWNGLWYALDRRIVHARFSIDAGNVLLNVEQLNTLIHRMEQIRARIDAVRRDTSYLKVASLPLRLNLLYLEGKVNQVCAKVKVYEKMGSQAAMQYIKSEELNIARPERA